MPVRKRVSTDPRCIALAVAAAFAPWFVPAAHAQIAANTLPTGGQVSAGAASISTDGSKMQIDQSTGRAILNWQSFSVGSSAWVNFTQPGASSVALNRVVGNDPSHIFGRLTANGQVFLVNNAGVFFAPGSSVNVNALFASTLSISDQDFLAGRYQFFNPGSAGSVVNQGNIVTASGYTALVGPQVRNDGVIVARTGSIALVAANRVSLDLVGDGLISINVDQAALNASVINTGTLQADGGTVLLAARSANALLDTVINNSGIIRANSLVERNGEIVLDGGSAGVVAVTGTLEAAGTEAGTTGGTVKVLGQYVGLFENANINASGDTAGGTVLVGGNWQGKGPEQNATRTIVGPDATISASANTNGAGGTVVVWADDVTKFFGSIEARGGAQGGNGGSVETSGKNVLQALGSVNVSAANGKGGLWLLDPNNITIQNNAGANANINVVANDFTSVDDDAVVDTAVLGAALTGGATVNVITGNGGADGQNGDITVQDTTTAAGNATLQLHAQGNITFAAGASITGGGNDLNVNVLAGTDGPAGAPGTNPSTTIAMHPTSSITTGNGNVTAIANGDIELAAITTGTGSLTVNTSGGGAITQVAALSVGGIGSFSAGAANDITLDNAANNFSTVSVVSGNNVVITDVSAVDLGASTISGALTVTANGAITDSGPLAVAGTSVFTAGAANNITLNNANNFSTVSVVSANNVTLNDTNAINLGSTSATGSVTVTAGGTIGVIAAVSGTDVSLTANGAAGDITSNATGTISATTGAVQLTAGNDVLLGGAVSAATAVDIDFGQVAAGTFTNNAAITGTGVSVTGGANGDTFNVNTSLAAALVGGDGADSFVFAAGVVLTGTLSGGLGSDTLNLSAYTAATDVVLAGAAANGYSGTATGIVTFDTIDVLNGSSTVASSLTGLNGAATWSTTGTNAGSYISGASTLTFSNFASWTGNAGVDTFNLGHSVTGTVSGGDGADVFSYSAGAIGTLTGGLGSDTIVGPNGANDWATTAADAGTLNAQAFSSMENWTGGSAVDTFALAHNVTGTVSGGDGADVFSYSAGTIGTLTGGLGSDTIVGPNGANDWATTAADAGTLNTQAFSSMENWTGGTAVDTFALGHNVTGTVSGGDGADVFNYSAGTIATLAGGNDSDTLAGSTSYSISGADSGSAAGVTAFNGIENLTGTAASDTFAFGAAGTLSGLIDGLGAADTANYSAAATPLTVTFGTSIANVETVTGGGAGFTLAGGSNWSITGANSGTVDGITFTNWHNLTGTAGANTFTLGGAGTVSGAINGLGGGDSLAGSNAYSITGPDSGTATGVGSFAGIANLTGTANADTFTVNGGGSLSGGVNGLGGADALVGSTGYSISGADSGTATNVGTFSSIENLSGTTGADSFTLAGGSLSGTINGLGGSDALSGSTTYSISGPNAGTATGVASFTGIETLTGTGGNDTFTLAVASFNGTIDGAAGSDTLTAANVANNWVLTSVGAGTLNTTTIFTSIETMVGGTAMDTLSGSAPGGTTTMIDPTSLALGPLNASGGVVNLTAGSLGGTGVIVADSGTFVSNANVLGLGVNIASNLHMDGSATLWNFSAGSNAGSFSVANANISVQVAGVTRVASVGQQQVAAAIGTVAEQIGATIVEEANKTFGTDSVAEDVEYGFAGEIGATPPMDHRIDESGISLPRCVEEAREGMPCK